MDDIRAEQRAWLRQVLENTGLSATALAKASGLAQTTVTNFLNDPDYPHALSARTIAALERGSRMKFGVMPRRAGLAEPEAQPYVPQADDIVGAAVARLIGERNALAPWRLASRAIEAAGYLPGDVLIVDLNLAPLPGDVVCAQVYQWRRLTAETVFRVFEPPYLLAKSFERTGSPLLAVDNQNVVVKGVVVASIRPRQSRAA